MQALGGDNAAPGSDILWLELMSEEKETLLQKMKANGTTFEINLIFSQIFISEWTLSLMLSHLVRQQVLVLHEKLSLDLIWKYSPMLR